MEAWVMVGGILHHIWESTVVGSCGSRSRCICSQKAESHQAGLVFSFIFIQEHARGMMLPTFQVSLPISINPIQKLPCKFCLLSDSRTRGVDNPVGHYNRRLARANAFSQRERKEQTLAQCEGTMEPIGGHHVRLGC